MAPAGSMITNGSAPVTRFSSGGGDSWLTSMRATTNEVTPCSRKLFAMCCRGGGGYTMAVIVVDDESGDRLIYMTVVLRVIHVTVIVDGCDSRWQ